MTRTHTLSKHHIEDAQTRRIVHAHENAPAMIVTPYELRSPTRARENARLYRANIGL